MPTLSVLKASVARSTNIVNRLFSLIAMCLSKQMNESSARYELLPSLVTSAYGSKTLLMFEIRRSPKIDTRSEIVSIPTMMP